GGGGAPGAGPRAAARAAAAAVGGGPLDPRPRRSGPPLPRPGLTAGRGQSDRSGGITIFSHHVHGPTTFTVPLPENLAVTAAAPGASVPLDIRVVPLEAAPGVAPSPRERVTATSPQVAKIT